MQKSKKINTDISERIKYLLDFKGVNANSFAKELGYQRSQTLYDIINRKSAPSYDFFLRFENAGYSEIFNIRWLLNGNGEMLVAPNNANTKKETTPSFDDNSNTLSDPNNTDSVHPTLSKNVQPTVHPTPINDEATLKNGNIIMIDLKAAAGLPGNLLKPYYYKDFPSFSLPGANYRFGRFLCVQINGDSMHPTIKHNEWLIAEEKETLSAIKSGHVYLVITKDAVLCKRVYYNNLATFIELHSDNDDVYPIEKISVTDVLKIYKGTDKLTNDFRNYDSDMRKDVAHLKEQISDLWKVVKSQSK